LFDIFDFIFFASFCRLTFFVDFCVVIDSGYVYICPALVHFLIFYFFFYFFIFYSIFYSAGCGTAQFSCDGRCVPLKWKCDGETDCADGSDELSFCARCASDEFRCQSGRCLPKSYLCDGTADCGINGQEDRSDEDPSICLHKASCPPNFYSCRHEARCIHLSQFCNGIADCNDRSDEHHKCEDWHNITCHYGVGLTLDGPVCYCPTDQVSVGDRCEPEQKCQAPICSQLCRDLDNGLVECECRDGFKPNGSYCDPRDPLGNLVALIGNTFAMTSSVKWDEFPGRYLRTVNQNRRVIAATMNTNRDWICYLMAAVKVVRKMGGDWARIASRRDGVLIVRSLQDPRTYAFMECSRITKKSMKVMVTDISASFPFDEVRSFRHDPIGDNWLFLVGRTRLVICRNAEPVMKKCRIIVDDVDIEDFVVDSSVGLIFYSTIGRGAGVWRVRYENNTKISMSERALQMPGGLAVDPYSRTLYYTDRYFERIFAIDYDRNGTTRSVVHDKRLKYSTSLTFFADYLYVPSRAELVRVDTVTSQLEAVDFHSSLEVDRGCLSGNGGCSDICVADGESGKLCLCSDGTSLINGKCTTNAIGESVLLYSRLSPMWIHGVRFDSSAHTRTAVFTVDSLTDEIYVFDEARSIIYKRALQGGNITVITKNGVRHLTCMTFDSASGNLYYGTRPNGFSSSRAPLKFVSIVSSELTWTERIPRCDSMTCIPKHLLCDGRADCEDRSDEKWTVCKESRECDADHFQCLTGQCIPLRWACDGRANCRDGSDELHCLEGCRIGREFRCDPSSACLPIALKCDGVPDCANGFDEQNCANITKVLIIQP
uniref:EGF-like domain-containing protein n=1 Tax=Nippostrongylus brasiliensis TaxID=27835 RepID=A0A158QWS6_NIPBR